MDNTEFISQPKARRNGISGTPILLCGDFMEGKELVVPGLSALLSESQMQELGELREEIEVAWSNQPIWRTFTEAMYSVLNDIKHPTAASKYHQSIREQLVFFENLVALGFEYRRSQINLRKKIKEIEKATDLDDKELLEVDRDELLWQIQGMQQQAKDRMRELKMWSEIKKGLDDGSFDTSNKDTDQLIALTVRYCREALLIGGKTSSDIGAVVNIMGQATTCLTECRRRNIVEKLPLECINVLKKIDHQQFKLR